MATLHNPYSQTTGPANNNTSSNNQSPAPVNFASPLSLKLDDKNFLLWNQQVEGVIDAHKLHRFVVNPVIPTRYAAETNRNLDIATPEYQQWLVQDQLLFTWLLSSLSESVLPRVLGCKHSWQIWEKIHKYFYSHLKAKVRQFRSELQNTKKGTSPINEYLLRIKALVDSLMAIGDPISDQDHVDAMLEGLPEEYNSFVMMIYSKLGTPSIDEIEGLLLMQEDQFERYRQDLVALAVSVNLTQGPQNSNPNFQ